jgi:hypothetical protein
MVILNRSTYRYMNKLLYCQDLIYRGADMSSDLENLPNIDASLYGKFLSNQDFVLNKNEIAIMYELFKKLLNELIDESHLQPNLNKLRKLYDINGRQLYLNTDLYQTDREITYKNHMLNLCSFCQCRDIEFCVIDMSGIEQIDMQIIWYKNVRNFNRAKLLTELNKNYNISKIEFDQRIEKLVHKGFAGVQPDSDFNLSQKGKKLIELNILS